MSTCPHCGCSKFEIENGGPSWNTAVFQCGYAVALLDDGPKPCAGCRHFALTTRARRIALRHVPKAEAIEAAIIMALMGGAALVCEPALPTWWLQWSAHMGGKVLLAVAAFGIIMHVVKVFVSHVREARKRVWASLKKRGEA